MRMIVALFWACSLSMALGSQAWSTHPTEGVLSLETLIQEALLHNPGIKALDANLVAAKASRRSAIGAYAPEVSLEGGPVATRFSDEPDSGTAAYGKLEWNLYRGGRDSANNEKTMIEERLARFHLDQTKAAVAREVARVYFEMAFLLESIAIKEKALELNREQTQLSLKKRAAGFTSEADVIEFELREATLRSDLKELFQARESKSRELSVLIGRKGAPGDLAVKGHLEKPAEIPNRDKLLSLLRDRNPDVIEAQAGLESSEQEVKAARAGFLPKIDIQAKYGKLATEERLFPEEDNYTAGVVVNIPLFSGLTTANDLAAAKARSAKSGAELTNRSLASRAEAENLLSELTLTLDRLGLEENTLSRSEQYYKITLGEYRRGVKNSPDMVGASERSLNSKIRNLEFRRDYQLTLLKVLALVGAGPGDRSLFAQDSASTAKAKSPVTLGPGKIHEECMTLETNQRLSYSFESGASPLDFNIHYHVGNEVFFPVKQDRTQSGKSTFKAKLKQDYCLMWTNKSKQPVELKYDFKTE